MRRHEFTDEQFKKIEHILPGQKGYVGVTAKYNKMFIDAVALQPNIVNVGNIF